MSSRRAVTLQVIAAMAAAGLALGGCVSTPGEAAATKNAVTASETPTSNQRPEREPEIDRGLQPEHEPKRERRPESWAAYPQPPAEADDQGTNGWFSFSVPVPPVPEPPLNGPGRYPPDEFISRTAMLPLPPVPRVRDVGSDRYRRPAVPPGPSVAAALPPPEPEPPADRVSDGAREERSPVPSRRPVETSDPQGDEVRAATESTPPTRESHTPIPTETQPRTPTSIPREERTESERSVALGDVFTLFLPGDGWIFIGEAENVEYMDRRRGPDGVTFRFRTVRDDDVVDATDDGTASSGRTAVLRFEARDVSTGSRRSHEERLTVTDPMPAQRIASTEAPAEDPLRTSREPSPVMEDSGLGGAAGGLQAGAGQAPSGTGGGASRAAAVIEALTSETAAGDIPSRDELLILVEELSAERPAEAVGLLEAMRSAGVRGEDELILRLAEIYESPWPGRDVRRARALYEQVVEGYPFSSFRGRALRRIEYLNRHFFFIR